MDKNTRKKLDAIKTNRQNREFMAFVGDMKNSTVFVDGDVFTRIYVTVAFTGQVLKVKNYLFPSRLGILVKVGYPENSSVLQVVSVMNEVFPDLDLPNLPYHSHTWGLTDNPAWIRPQNMLEMLPSKKEGMTVSVNSGFYKINSGIKVFIKSDFDMSGYVPTDGSRWVAVDVDVNGDISYSVGSTQTGGKLSLNGTNLPDEDIFKHRLFLVKTYVGQTELSWIPDDNDIFDPRYVSGYEYYLDTDTTLSADSDQRLATQKAVKAFVPSEIVLVGDDRYIKKFYETSDPDADFDYSNGYLVLDHVVNTVTQDVFICVDNTNASAVWINIANAVAGGGGSGDIGWLIDGVIAVLDPASVPILITKAMTIESVFVYLEDLGGSGSTNVDVNILGGSSILSAEISVPYNDSNGWVKVAPATTSLSEGDILVLSTTSVAVGAANMRVVIVPTSDAGGGTTPAEIPASLYTLMNWSFR